MLTETEARALTERIKQAVEELWLMLDEAYHRRAWAALHYQSFRSYVQNELGMSRSRAYQLLDQAKVIREITSAAGVSTFVDVTEAEARDLLPHLQTVIENVRDATVDTEPELKPQAARAAVEETRQHIRAISKPDLGNGISHPARYTAELLPIFAQFLKPQWRVLDPFAGVGGIHDLRDFVAVETIGVEIEPEWAAMHPHTQEGDAVDLNFADECFDAIVTSPTYGNRLADHHEASDPDKRRTYRHDLGRALHERNSGRLQWGPKYREFHRAAWEEALRVLRPGGIFLLNVKDHIRDGRRQSVSAWHAQTLLELGCGFVDCVPVATPSLRFGANATSRVDAELVWAFTKEIGR
jgi:SAM-dependent methyltransferase